MKNYYKSKGCSYIRNQIAERDGAARAEAVFDRANRLCEEYKKKYRASGAEGIHLSMITTRAALYTVLKEEYPDDAWEWIDRMTWHESQPMKKFIGVITSNKALRVIVMPMMRKMTRRMFGNKAGFDNKEVEVKKDVYAFDIYECPYKKWCAEMGVPELTKVFCDADHYSYDGLSCFEFSRSSTLGYDGEKCDFRYWLK